MKEKKLSETLLKRAVSLGLCEEWTNAWGNPDPQALIDKYIRGIDFAIKHDYPSTSFIKKNFSKEILHKNNIFVDEKVQCNNPKHVVVLNGECSGILQFNSYAVCNIYVRHKCDITVNCSEYCKVFINVYDSSKVKVSQEDISSVYVYTHSENCTIETDGDVMIRKSQM